MLEQINRVLKPGGRLILTTPNITSSHALWKMLRGIEPYFYMQYHRDGSPYRHNYEYSRGGLETLLKAAGFDGDIWTEDSFEDGISDDATFLENAGFKINKDLLGDNLFASVYKKSEVVDRYPSPIYV
jgi:SAM-dependent methyltransferase